VNYAKYNLKWFLSLPLKIFRRFWKSPIPLGLWLMNTFFQRILRINGQVPWMVHYTSQVTADIEIGEDVWISFALSGNCYIQGGNGVIIGDGTIFAPGVKIISANHDVKDYVTWVKDKPIQIGKHCWLGANVTILPGVKLGDNVIVGAGSVVTKSFSQENITIAGVPAKMISTKSIKGLL
jgi:acetyltransferase-like isoleucine patch superfamily enzyme